MISLCLSGLFLLFDTAWKADRWELFELRRRGRWRLKKKKTVRRRHGAAKANSGNGTKGLSADTPIRSWEKWAWSLFKSFVWPEHQALCSGQDDKWDLLNTVPFFFLLSNDLNTFSAQLLISKRKDYCFSNPGLVCIDIHLPFWLLVLFLFTCLPLVGSLMFLRAVNFVGAGKWNRAETPLDLGYFQRKFLKHPTWKAPLWGISLYGNNDFTASLTGTIDNCFLFCLWHGAAAAGLNQSDPNSHSLTCLKFVSVATYFDWPRSR